MKVARSSTRSLPKRICCVRIHLRVHLTYTNSTWTLSSSAVIDSLKFLVSDRNYTQWQFTSVIELFWKQSGMKTLRSPGHSVSSADIALTIIHYPPLVYRMDVIIHLDLRQLYNLVIKWVNFQLFFNHN